MERRLCIWEKKVSYSAFIPAIYSSLVNWRPWLWPVLTPWSHCSCPIASGAEYSCWDRDKNSHARTPLPTLFAKSHSARHFSHQFPNTQLYSFLARTQKSGCSHERGRACCPRRRWPSWAEGTTHHQGNTLVPVKQWRVHVRIQEHTHTVTRSVILTDVLVCQYKWSRFSIPLLVRLYFPHGWGFMLCFKEKRKWPPGTGQPCSLQSNPTSCVPCTLQEDLNSAWGTEEHPTPLMYCMYNRPCCIRDMFTEMGNIFIKVIWNCLF